jgi:hypothetical protein
LPNYIPSAYVAHIYGRMQFGTGALLDPVWDADKFANCSKTYSTLLDKLSSFRTSGEARAANTAVLRTLVNALSQNGLSEHVDWLLETVPQS